MEDLICLLGTVRTLKMSSLLKYQLCSNHDIHLISIPHIHFFMLIIFPLSIHSPPLPFQFSALQFILNSLALLKFMYLFPVAKSLCDTMFMSMIMLPIWSFWVVFLLMFLFHCLMYILHPSLFSLSVFFSKPYLYISCYSFYLVGMYRIHSDFIFPHHQFVLCIISFVSSNLLTVVNFVA